MGQVCGRGWTKAQEHCVIETDKDLRKGWGCSSVVEACLTPLKPQAPSPPTPKKREGGRGRAMAQWLKVLATKPANLSWISKTHEKKGDNDSPKVSSDLHLKAVAM